MRLLPLDDGRATVKATAGVGNNAGGQANVFELAV
jgi:hypothetical protein